MSSSHSLSLSHSRAACSAHSRVHFGKQRKIVACKAARMVYDVHEHMTTSAWERGMTGARGFASATKDAAKAGVEAMPSIRAGAKVVARELGEEALTQLSRRVPLDRLPVVGARIAARVQQAQA